MSLTNWYLITKTKLSWRYSQFIFSVLEVNLSNQHVQIQLEKFTVDEFNIFFWRADQTIRVCFAVFQSQLIQFKWTHIRQATRHRSWNWTMIAYWRYSSTWIWPIWQTRLSFLHDFTWMQSGASYIQKWRGLNTINIEICWQTLEYCGILEHFSTKFICFHHVMERRKYLNWLVGIRLQLNFPFRFADWSV